MRNETLHPYKAINKVTVSCVLISLSLDRKRLGEKIWGELLRQLPEFNVAIISSFLKFDPAVREDLIVSSTESVHYLR